MPRSKSKAITGALVLFITPALTLRAQAPTNSPASPPPTQPIPATTQQVTVTAYRAPLGDLESPATTRVLTQSALATTPAITLDDQLRQLPGVELFRRSPSLVANPTSQGISLRALGSTSASRTLVTEDDVPLNDPLGGWIHWQEQPELSINDIELVRGGASDLYGSQRHRRRHQHCSRHAPRPKSSRIRQHLRRRRNLR